MTRGLTVREFDREGDYLACRALWANLVEHHRRVFGDERIGGPDPGSGLDYFLSLPTRVCACVAVDGDEVVGMSGLIIAPDRTEVEPMVVWDSHRGQGVATALVAHVVGEARGRGVTTLHIRPYARNAESVTAFHRLGFTNLDHLDMTMDIVPGQLPRIPGITIHGVAFNA